MVLGLGIPPVKPYAFGMKPGDHPDFFRFPAPEGRSRESTIRLDSEGHFWHEGGRVEHPKLEAAMHGWIARHPDDGRYILTNGYDWTYFIVDDVPYYVRALRIEGGHVDLVLSDGSTEPWRPDRSWLGKQGAIYTYVKGDFPARFTQHAQTSLASVLEEDPSSPDKDGDVWVVLGQTRTRLGSQELAPNDAEATLVHRG